MIANPLQINDWQIKKFLRVVIAIQLAIWGAIGLDALDFQIPILRQLIGFIYLTFIPGFVILRIIRLHKLGNIETVLYTVGLSIATLMFTGFLMNTVYPFFGISKPISITPLIITISAVVLMLCVLCYVRDKDFSDPSFINIGEVLSPPVLFLCLIPFLAIFGTYLVNFYHNNIILMFLIVVLALTASSIAFGKSIPKNLYPLAIFVIALSLIYSHTLISMYIVGNDVQTEYFYSNLVISDSKWVSTTPCNVNAMLSTSMFFPIFSLISRLDLTWVFKVFCPLLLAIEVLGLYKIYQHQTNEKIAFLSCFFFTAIFMFYRIMPAQENQLIAHFFFISLILLILNKTINKMKRSLLSIIFGSSLVVSHYGLSYIYMFCLISAWLIVVLAGNPNIQKIGDNFHSKFCRKEVVLVENSNSFLEIRDRTIRSTSVLLFTLFALTWYMHVSSSSALTTIVHIGDHIASSIWTDFLNRESAQGLDIIMAKAGSFIGLINKYIHLLTQFFIAIGIFSLLFYHDKLKFNKEYIVLSYINFVICIGAIVLPHFSSAIWTARLYFITLIFLAPFSTIGCIFIFDFISRINKNHTDRVNGVKKMAIRTMTVVFVLLLLFDSGWMCEVTQQNPHSFALSQNSIYESKDVNATISFYTAVTPEKDVFGSKWLSAHIHDESRIYATYTDLRVHSLQSYGGFARYRVAPLTNETTVVMDSYIFLQSLNVIQGLGNNCDTIEEYMPYNISENKPLLKNMKDIYSNGGVEIYYQSPK